MVTSIAISTVIWFQCIFINLFLFYGLPMSSVTLNLLNPLWCSDRWIWLSN